jgi:hypothetical protein
MQTVSLSATLDRMLTLRGTKASALTAEKETDENQGQGLRVKGRGVRFP